MKVTFYSNFLTHHQVPFCLEMQKRLGDDFKFVSMSKIFQWRLDLGFKDLDQEYDFVIRAYENEEQREIAKKLADESDIVMIGSTLDDLIEDRLKQDKIVFRYRYRIFLFPDGFFKTIFNKEKMKMFYQRHLKYRRNENLYLLCANAYAPNDFSMFGLYKNKIYKWGYFLETNKYDIDKLIEQKEKNNPVEIIWVARFISWKHPELAVKLAKNLKRQNYKFKIKMLGTGVLEKEIEKQINKNNLQDVIEIVGQVDYDKVKYYYEKANIFIGTSDFNEGWGAVVNEAMNGGCTIVACDKMGSVPFLVENNKNGITFSKYQELENAVKFLIENPEERKKLAKNAYKYITEQWTASVAAENLLETCDAILNKRETKVQYGPASKANKLI